jgi:hypothetical protein
MSAPAWAFSDFDPPFIVVSTHVTDDGTGAGPHDAGILIYPQAGNDQPPAWVSDEAIREAMEKIKDELLGMVSSGLSLIPGVGQLKGLVEGALGHDLITGHHLAWWEQILNVASAIPHIHDAEGILKTVSEIGHDAHIVNMGVHGTHGIVHGVGAATTGADAESGDPPASDLPPPTGE